MVDFRASAIIAIALALPLPTSWAAADERIGFSAIAAHNNSIMRLEFAASGSLKILYQHPRPELNRIGVFPGTTLFQGRVRGVDIFGEAYTFRQGCAPAPYSVAGQLDGDTIRLHGPAPVRSGCSVIRLDPDIPNAELIFAGRPEELPRLFAFAGSTPTVPGGSFDRMEPPLTSAGLLDKIRRDPFSIIAATKDLHQVHGMELKALDLDGDGVVSREELHGRMSLDTCQVLEGSADGTSGIFLERAFWTAMYYHYVAEILSVAGYPEEVWRAALEQVVTGRFAVLNAQLQQGGDLIDENSIRSPILVFERRLISKLDAYRMRNNPSLPEPAPFQELCGGDFVADVALETEPAGGFVRLIREFYFDLCRVIGIRPYSDDCDAWMSVGVRQEFPVGIYRYIASWAGEHTECGRVNLDDPVARRERGMVDAVFILRRSGQPCQERER